MTVENAVPWAIVCFERRSPTCRERWLRKFFHATADAVVPGLESTRCKIKTLFLQNQKNIVYLQVLKKRFFNVINNK